MNTYLKKSIIEINNFLKTHNQPPEDLIDDLIMELSVSNLYIAAIIEGDELNFEHMESDDGLKILPLFTDKEEYNGDNELMQNEMSFFAEIVDECDFDGAIINPNNENNFFVVKDLIVKLKEEIISVDDDDIPEAADLKEESKKVRNEELLKFIQDESNFNNFDELIEKFRDVVLLNVVASPEDLTDYLHDGILLTLEVGGFSLSIRTVGTEKYGLLFTSLDAINKTCDRNSGVHYYYQVAGLGRLLEYILMNDLDGIIINPALENYYIPRKVLLNLFVNHKDIINNPRYYYSMHYAFPLD